MTREEDDVPFRTLTAGGSVLFSLFAFSTLGECETEPAAALAKSSPLPGDFGVLADPNEAKAPEPSPKAEEAPGEATPPVVLRGAMALKGFDLPCEEPSPPNRLDGL